MNARKQYTAPKFETLETRQHMTVATTDMGTLAASEYPTGPSHFTTLYVNFDGGTINDAQAGGKVKVSAFQAMPGDNRETAIQDILYRVSEMFSQFNVRVQRMSGAGMYDSSTNGSTTIFVGSVDGDVNNAGVKQPNAWTPIASNDFPCFAKGIGHVINSDNYDIAFVDPVGTQNRRRATVESDQQIAQGIAHEAGHTFGLANVDSAAQPDVMSYTDSNTLFNDATFNITDEQFNVKTDTIDQTGLVPMIFGFTTILNHRIPVRQQLTTQDSFEVLNDVLNPQDVLIVGPQHFVADPTTVNQKAILNPLMPNVLHVGDLVDDVIGYGDGDAYTIANTSNKSQYVTVQLGNITTLSPEILAYDAKGSTLLAVQDGQSVNLKLAANSSYKVVIESFEGNSAGRCTISVTSTAASKNNAITLNSQKPLIHGGSVLGFSNNPIELLADPTYTPGLPA